MKIEDIYKFISYQERNRGNIFESLLTSVITSIHSGYGDFIKDQIKIVNEKRDKNIEEILEKVK